MTKKKLAKYEKRLRYWQKQFNLMDYELLRASSEPIDDDSDQAIISSLCWNHSNRWVKVRINEDWDDTKKELNRAAFHEMLELRLGKLRDMACEKFSWDEVDEQIHIVIRTMENLILK